MSFPQGPGNGNNPNPDNNRNNGNPFTNPFNRGNNGTNGKGNNNENRPIWQSLAVGCRTRGHGRADVPDVRRRWHEDH